MAKCEKILIAGFSGSGKSTVLKALAALRPEGWELFQDLDDVLALKMGKDLPTIIEKEGWPKFRELEQEALFHWINLPQKGFLALGGGTLSEEALKRLKLRENVRVVYLHADFETCWGRFHLPEAPVRPLIQRGKAEMEKIYQERQQVFQKVPLKIDNSEGVDLQKITKEILSSLTLS